jgi:surface carbohydrate biosynthesis protein
MTRPRPSVALIVDQPQRDLAGMVLIALELCRREVVCHLVPMNLAGKELGAVAPDFILLNYFRTSNQSLARQLIEAGIRLGVLDTEGAVVPDEGWYTTALWQEAELRRQLRCVCMWGPRLAAYVANQGILTPDQVAITGCPRFDFYHPRWQRVVRDSSDESPARILINTKYSITNSRFATAAENVRQLGDDLGVPPDVVAAIVEAERQAIDATIELAKNLARDYPNAAIVFRPHPFENADLYRRRLGDNSRIMVENDGPVQPEICRASAVIQRSCTTAIEAGLAGVPALSPKWVPAPVVGPMADMVNVPCETYGDMRDRLDAIFAGTYEAPGEVRRAIDGVTREWFFQADGLAHRRVADAIVRQLGDSRTVDERRCARLVYGLGESSTFTAAELGRVLRYRLGLSPDWCFRQLRRVPRQNRPGKAFGVTEVQALTDRIQRVDPALGASRVAVTAAGEHPNPRGQLRLHSITMACER